MHLEMTTKCNARCPMCPRNRQGGRPVAHLPLCELSLADIQRIFPEDFVRQLVLIYLCGNYGDAMVAHDTLEALAYFRQSHPAIALKLFTNGGGRTKDWWVALAGVVNTCTFGFDGLADTNHLYRRGTIWSTCLRSAEAFIEAGGRAEWDFLVFRHNEHQVEEARELSRRLGFAKFNVKKTARFLVDGQVVERYPVRDGEGAVEYELQMPRDPALRNLGLDEFERAQAAGEDHRAYLASTPVACKVAETRQIYVSGEGCVFPCCWTARLHDSPPGEGELWTLLRQLPEGLASIDARRHPIAEIIDGPFFQSLISGSWVPGSAARGCYTVCARTCGVRNQIGRQF